MEGYFPAGQIAAAAVVGLADFAAVSYLVVDLAKDPTWRADYRRIIRKRGNMDWTLDWWSAFIPNNNKHILSMHITDCLPADPLHYFLPDL